MIAVGNPIKPDVLHPYVVMWVTGDGHIRQALLPSGRDDEARGKRQSTAASSKANPLFAAPTGYATSGIRSIILSNVIG
jgi:hypothetical protein